MMEQQHTSITLEETAVQDLVSHLRGALHEWGQCDALVAYHIDRGQIHRVAVSGLCLVDIV